MSDKSEKKTIRDWFRGVSAEFRKISWPDKDMLIRETTTVTVVSVILGIIIATLDMILQYGINFFI